ncbi:MAG: helix-turn-helix transcriptional regulator [Clostridia bacterium]|nr:helix-turn-helix transcriptional regulator [Clostridia bacterium]
MTNPIRLVIFKSNNYKESDNKRFMKMHKHSSIEISYVISGELTLEFYSEETKKTETTYIFPQQFFIIKPNCQHRVNIPSSLMSLGLEFVVEEGNIMEHLKKSSYIANLPLASNLLKDFQDILIFRDNQNVAYLLNQFKKYTEINSGDIFLEDIYELELKRLLIEILKCTKESRFISGQNIYMKKAISFIESNYTRDLNAKAVAAYLGISEVYLQKMFRSNLNTSISSFINETRVSKAKSLIATTNFPIKKISKDIGYNSIQAFILNFKKLTGFTPTEYKRTEIHNDNLEFFAENKNYHESKI